MGIFRFAKKIIVIFAFVYLAIYFVPLANKYLDGYLSDYSKDAKNKITGYIVDEFAVPLVDKIADSIRDNGKKALSDITVPGSKNINVSNNNNN